MSPQDFPQPRSAAARPGARLARCLRGAVAAGALASFARAELKIGEPFPALAPAQLTGGELPSSAGKILIVDFWASWCAPCKASFPALGRIAGDYATRGVVLIGVSVDENPAAFAAFVKKFAPPFPTLHDARQNLARAVQVPAMPTTYLIDRQGTVRSVHTGFHGDSSVRQLRAGIDALLASQG